MNSFYSENELKNLNLKKYGKNISISRYARIYNPEEIEIGNNVRIDDFSFLSGKIRIGNNVHIACFAELNAGEAGIVMDDFSGLSSKVSVFAVSDDYSGKSLTNPTVPDAFKRLKKAKVVIAKHVIVGASSVILPGSRLEEGVAVGACSLIRDRCEEWFVYSGIPAKKIKEREKQALILEKEYLNRYGVPERK